MSGRRSKSSLALVMVCGLLSMTLCAQNIDYPSADVAPATDLNSANLLPGATISVKLRFRDLIKLSKTRLNLNDLAQCEGNASRCEEVKYVDFGLAPRPGERRLINESEVRAILKAEFPEDDFVLETPERIAIESYFQEVDHLQIESYLHSLVSAKISSYNNIRLKSARILFAKKIKLPAGEVQLQIPLLNELNFADWNGVANELQGRKVLDIICSLKDAQGELTTHHIKASAHLEMELFLPTANATKRVGEMLAHEDLTYRWLALNRQSAQAIRDVKDVVGKNLKQPLQQGRFILPMSVATDSLVTKGRAVKVILSNAGISITADAKALESAGMGQEVKIYYPSTKANLFGKVVGENLVEVRL